MEERDIPTKKEKKEWYGGGGISHRKVDTGASTHFPEPLDQINQRAIPKRNEPSDVCIWPEGQAHLGAVTNSLAIRRMRSVQFKSEESKAAMACEDVGRAHPEDGGTNGMMEGRG